MKGRNCFQHTVGYSRHGGVEDSGASLPKLAVVHHSDIFNNCRRAEVVEHVVRDQAADVWDV